MFIELIYFVEKFFIKISILTLYLVLFQRIHEHKQ